MHSTLIVIHGKRHRRYAGGVGFRHRLRLNGAQPRLAGGHDGRVELGVDPRVFILINDILINGVVLNTVQIDGAKISVTLSFCTIRDSTTKRAEHRINGHALRAIRPPSHVEIAETCGLIEFHPTLLVQLQYREKSHDDLRRLTHPDGEHAKGCVAKAGKGLGKFADRFSDRHANRGHMVELNGGRVLRERQLRHHSPKRVAKLFGRGTGQRVGGNCGEALLNDVGTRVGLRGRCFDSAKVSRSTTKRLILQQLGEQKVALFEQRQFFVEVNRGSLGQQTAQFQFDQCRSDEKKLRGHFKVERLHQLDFANKGVDNARKGHLVEVYLLLGNQIQKQIEWPLEYRGGDID